MPKNTTPFDIAVQQGDLIFSKLLEKSDQIDEIVLPLLQNLFTAIKQLLARMIPEYLPGGKYWDASDNFRQQTRSVAKHNKMPEFIFGQLDHSISFRPNASVHLQMRRFFCIHTTKYPNGCHLFQQMKKTN